jgi:hypothetical protein
MQRFLLVLKAFAVMIVAGFGGGAIGAGLKASHDGSEIGFGTFLLVGAFFLYRMSQTEALPDDALKLREGRRSHDNVDVGNATRYRPSPLRLDVVADPALDLIESHRVGGVRCEAATGGSDLEGPPASLAELKA